MFPVPFITAEDEPPDLIVSFPLDAAAARNLTLLRTPRYEGLLDAHERGVSVSDGSGEGDRRELLRSVHWLDGQAVVTSDRRQFRLDLSRVEAQDIAEAKRVLVKMNFDRRFEVRGG